MEHIMEQLLIVFASVVTVCTIIGLFLAVKVLFKPNRRISLTERLSFHSMSKVTLLGIVACIAGLSLASTLSTIAFIALIIDLVLLIIQLAIYHFK